MALSDKQKALLLAKVQYRDGAINSIPLVALFNALEAYKGPYGTTTAPDVRDKTFAALDGTPQTVITGPSRLYGVLVKSPAGANDAVYVEFTDGAPASNFMAAVTVSPEKAAAGVYFGGTDGVGIPFTTAIVVTAYQSVGYTTVDAEDKPEVTVLYG